MKNQETGFKKTPEQVQNQPTATELSQLAIMLAQAQKKPITPENREELLRAACDLWCASDNLIRERKQATEKEISSRESAAWEEIGLRFHNETVSFKTMVEQKRLRRNSTGKKSEPFISSVEGAKKAFKAFHKSACGTELAVGETKPVGSAALLFLDEPCAQVLKCGAMSKALFAAFLAWQKERSGPERPKIETTSTVERVQPCPEEKDKHPRKAEDAKLARSVVQKNFLPSLSNRPPKKRGSRRN